MERRECNDSRKLAQYLFEMGYTNIKVLIDGYCFSLGDAGHVASPAVGIVRNIICFFLSLHLLFYKGPGRCCIRQSGSIKETFYIQTDKMKE